VRPNRNLVASCEPVLALGKDCRKVGLPGVAAVNVGIAGLAAE
jgi:hypothetical protein